VAYLPFFRKGTVAAYVNPTVVIYTQPLITEKFIKVVAALHIDAPMVSTHFQDGFQVFPQISNDLVVWADKTPSFTLVTPGSTFPITEIKEFTEIAKYMRFKLVLSKPVLAGPLGVTLSLLADGKSTSHEMLDAQYGFYSPAFLRPTFYPVAAPASMVSRGFASSGGGLAASPVVASAQAGLTTPAGGGTQSVSGANTGQASQTAQAATGQGVSPVSSTALLARRR